MKITINIDEHLFDQASKLTGIKEKTMLVKLGLEALIARESSNRLVKLGGTEKGVKAIPRTMAEESYNRHKQLEITYLFDTMEPDADYDYKKGRAR
jgi:hypothetical protein